VSDRSLADALARHAATFEDVIVRPADGVREVVAAGSVVAVLGPALEVRLRPAVAAAALRTPDVEASARGAGWVRFAPPDVDEFARDRAVAWLESAIRLAIEAGPRD
jgi:hypothetical protein